MDAKARRRIALAVATLGIALGAGHLVQSGRGGDARQAAAEVPTAIVPLAAGEVPAAPALAALLPADPAPPVLLPPAALPPARPPKTAAADPCALTLAVTAGLRATLDVTFIAPCAPQARLVLRHGGLAVTGRTSATGRLTVSLPALDPAGRVSVRLRGGRQADAAAPVALDGIRRAAVQWHGADRFALNAFENGAAFGAPGHLTATGGAGAGTLVALGDATVDLPMLAEVYTFPADPALPVEVALEAPVTPQTCGRDLVGEILDSRAGRVTATDLTLAMPACDAQGGFLVLNNLWSGTTLAAAD